VAASRTLSRSASDQHRFEDRAVPGHWEGDLLCASKNSYIVTSVECHSRCVILAKVPNRETQTVVDALIRRQESLPNELYRTLIWDRGKELTDHKRFSMEIDIDVYFCDRKAPGRAAQKKTPIACCASTSPRVLTSRRTAVVVDFAEGCSWAVVDAPF
jgi:IS30 family transposase